MNKMEFILFVLHDNRIDLQFRKILHNPNRLFHARLNVIEADAKPILEPFDALNEENSGKQVIRGGPWIPCVLFQSRDVGEHLSTTKFSLTYRTSCLGHTDACVFNPSKYVRSYGHANTYTLDSR